MAATQLAVQQIARSGLTPVYSAANADGHFVANNGRLLLHFKNTGATPITVTLQTTKQIDGLDLADATVIVPITTGDKLVGGLSPELFGNVLNMTFSEVTGLTVAAFNY